MQNKKEIGKGGFAVCYLVQDTVLNKSVVLKRINKKTSKIAPKKIYAERDIHKTLDHKNILKYLDFFEDSEYWYIVTEWCEMGDLHTIITNRKKEGARFNEPEIKAIAIDLFNGLKYLWNQRIIHRDIKPGNILVTKKFEFKISDFGLSCRIEKVDERRKSFCGTPNFMAPEILTKLYGIEVDIWAAGMVLYILTYGKHPFDDGVVTQDVIFAKIKEGRIAYSNRINHALNNLLQSMLTYNFDTRHTINKLYLNPYLKSLPVISHKKNFMYISHVHRVVEFGYYYRLSDGKLGILFNDKSSLLCNPYTNEYQYIVEKLPTVPIPKDKLNLLNKYKSTLNIKDDISNVLPMVGHLQYIYPTKHCIFIRFAGYVQHTFNDKSVYVTTKSGDIYTNIYITQSRYVSEQLLIISRTYYNTFKAT